MYYGTSCGCIPTTRGTTAMLREKIAFLSWSHTSDPDNHKPDHVKAR